MGRYEESELHKLERSLAYSNASGYLDTTFACLIRDGERDWDWLELDGYERGDDPDVDDALRYLDLRGLLERDPKNLNHIAIRDESEATA
jgi:hypothetical protein